MTTVVCQDLRSCLDSQIFETTKMLRLRFPPPKLELDDLGEKCLQEETTEKSNFFHDQQQQASSIVDSGGWSFLQALYNTSPKEEQINKETTYVHPLVERSLSKLSEKSLKLCTENLGSETGSDISEESIMLLPPTREEQKTCQVSGAGIGKAKSRSFPPPLTTMNGYGKTFQIRQHREDGRLIIEATEYPTKPSLFQAERCNGRLLLGLVKDDSFVSSLEEAEANIVSSENDLELEEETQDWEEEFEEELEEGNRDSLEEFLKPGRCKEVELENNGLLIWEPLWVAIS